jgi:hypothetical protein
VEHSRQRQHAANAVPNYTKPNTQRRNDHTMQVSTAREPKPYETQRPTAGYVDKQQDTTILGQQTTSSQATLPALSPLPTDPVIPAEATDRQTQTQNRPSTPSPHTLFSYAPDRGTLTPSKRTYPRINLFLLLPDSVDWSLSGVLSVWGRLARYLRPSFGWASPRALEQAGV